MAILNKKFRDDAKIEPMISWSIFSDSIKYVDGKILRGLFEHERFKPAIVRTSHGNVISLAQLKQVLILGLVI